MRSNGAPPAGAGDRHPPHWAPGKMAPCRHHWFMTGSMVLRQHSCQGEWRACWDIDLDRNDGHELFFKNNMFPELGTGT